MARTINRHQLGAVNTLAIHRDKPETEKGIHLAASKSLHSVEISTLHFCGIQKVSDLIRSADDDATTFSHIVAVQRLFRNKQFSEREASHASSNSRLASSRSSARNARVGRSKSSINKHFVHRATHRHSRSAGIVRGRVDEHADLVLVIDEVGPVKILKGNATARMRSIDTRGVGVARGTALCSGRTNLFKKGILASNGFFTNCTAQLRPVLLDKVLDIGAVLFNEGRCHLN